MPCVLIPLAEGCEEIEAVTLIDLLRRADIEVVTASLGERQVRCSRDTVLVADVTLDEVAGRDFDMVVLPGGLPGADHLNADPRVPDILKRHAAAGRTVGAICAAPKVLAAAGLLEGRRFTAYPGALGDAGDAATGSMVESDNGVMTSRGPGTAMDFALEIIAHLRGEASRAQIERDLVRAEFEGNYVAKLTKPRKGISSLQLSKEFSVQQRTAWYMLHRLRLACGEDMEVLYGTVEVDEAYLGGKEHNKHESKRRRAGCGAVGKTAILGMRERKGRVKAMPVSDTSKATLQGIIHKHIRPGSTICTDDNPSYNGVAHRHKTVNHSAREYVNGMAAHERDRKHLGGAKTRLQRRLS